MEGQKTRSVSQLFISGFRPSMYGCSSELLLDYSNIVLTNIPVVAEVLFDVKGTF